MRVAEIQRGLIAVRVKHHADTLAGRICSDIIEELKNHKHAKATSNTFQLRKLGELIPAKVRRLAKALDRHQ